MGSGVSKQKVTVAAHEGATLKQVLLVHADIPVLAVEVKLEDNKFHPKNVTVYARQVSQVRDLAPDFAPRA